MNFKIHPDFPERKDAAVVSFVFNKLWMETTFCHVLTPFLTTIRVPRHLLSGSGTWRLKNPRASTGDQLNEREIQLTCSGIIRVFWLQKFNGRPVILNLNQGRAVPFVGAVRWHILPTLFNGIRSTQKVITRWAHGDLRLFRNHHFTAVSGHSHC